MNIATPGVDYVKCSKTLMAESFCKQDHHNTDHEKFRLALAKELAKPVMPQLPRRTRRPQPPPLPVISPPLPGDYIKFYTNDALFVRLDNSLLVPEKVRAKLKWMPEWLIGQVVELGSEESASFIVLTAHAVAPMKTICLFWELRQALCLCMAKGPKNP